LDHLPKEELAIKTPATTIPSNEKVLAALQPTELPPKVHSTLEVVAPPLPA